MKKKKKKIEFFFKNALFISKISISKLFKTRQLLKAPIPRIGKYPYYQNANITFSFYVVFVIVNFYFISWMGLAPYLWMENAWTLYSIFVFQKWQKHPGRTDSHFQRGRAIYSRCFRNRNKLKKRATSGPFHLFIILFHLMQWIFNMWGRCYHPCESWLS